MKGSPTLTATTTGKSTLYELNLRRQTKSLVYDSGTSVSNKQVANSFDKPKKKTVVEMLLTESQCLSNISKDMIVKFVSESQVLETDRREYLLLEIPKAQLGLVEMSRSESILGSPKTLMFFLGPYVHNGEAGTLMILIQSQDHKLFAVFLYREIIKTTKDDKGIFSFQFGPQKLSGVSIRQSSPNPIMTKSLSEHDQVQVSDKDNPNQAQFCSSHSFPNLIYTQNESYGSTSLKCANKVADEESKVFYDKHQYQTVTSPTTSLDMAAGPRKRFLPEDIANEKDLQIYPDGNLKQVTQLHEPQNEENLKSQVQSLQIALASNTKSFLAVEQITRTKLQAIMNGKVEQLRAENEELKKTIELLSVQIKILSSRLRCHEKTEPIIDSIVSSQSTHSLLAKPPRVCCNVLNSGTASIWSCRWSKCQNVRYHNKDDLLNHLIIAHVRPQSTSK